MTKGNPLGSQFRPLFDNLTFHKRKFIEKWVTHSGIVEMKDGCLYDKEYLGMEEDLDNLIARKN